MPSDLTPQVNMGPLPCFSRLQQGPNIGINPLSLGTKLGDNTVWLTYLHNMASWNTQWEQTKAETNIHHKSTVDYSNHSALTSYDWPEYSRAHPTGGPPPGGWAPPIWSGPTELVGPHQMGGRQVIILHFPYKNMLKNTLNENNS